MSALTSSGHLALDDSNRVRIILLTGSDPDTQYSAIQASASGAQPNWLYILAANGKGYLGDEPLFGGDAERFYVIDTDERDSTTKLITFTPEQGKIYYVVASDAKHTITDNSTTPATTTTEFLDKGKFYVYDGVNLVDFSYVAFQKMMADYILTTAVHAATDTGTTDPISGATIYSGGIQDLHNEQTIPTTEAVYQYITSQSIMDAQFFRHVIQYEIQTSDVTNANDTGTGGANENGEYDWVINPTTSAPYPAGTHGLKFTLDDDSLPGGEAYYFVDLTNMIREVDMENTPSIHLDVASSTNSHNIKADLNIKSGENSLLIDTTAGSQGVYLYKTTSDTTGASPTTSIPKVGDTSITTPAQAIAAASPDKLVTEQAFVVYMENFFKPYLDTILDDFVSYDIDDGT